MTSDPRATEQKRKRESKRGRGRGRGREGELLLLDSHLPGAAHPMDFAIQNLLY